MEDQGNQSRVYQCPGYLAISDGVQWQQEKSAGFLALLHQGVPPDRLKKGIAGNTYPAVFFQLCLHAGQLALCTSSDVLYQIEIQTANQIVHSTSSNQIIKIVYACKKKSY
jgi:hypothetical protein